MQLRKYQELMLKMMLDGYDSSPDKKFMVVTVPTASGKTTLIPFLFKKLRERDPKIRMIFSTSQHELVKNTLKEFSRYKEYNVINIKGIERLLKDIAAAGEKETTVEKAKKACCDLLDILGVECCVPEEKKKETEKYFVGKLEDALHMQRNIESLEKLRIKDTCQADVFKKQMAASYKDAEKTIEKMLQKIAKMVAIKQTGSQKPPASTVREKYMEILMVVRKNYAPVFVLFPDMEYELADVVILTHAKANISILTKRKLSLSDINYEKEGQHIVYVVDEEETQRSNYEETLREQAAKNTVDMLAFINRIYGALRLRYFENTDYISKDESGNEDDRVQKEAQKLTENFSAFFSKYGYVPNMHMGELKENEKAPTLVNCHKYFFISNGSAKMVSTDKSSQIVTLGENGNGNMNDFALDGRSLIRQFIGLCRNAGVIMNDKKSGEGDLPSSIRLVAIRAVGEEFADFVVDNSFSRFGARVVPGEERHPYRSDLSYISVRSMNRYGKDVMLSNISVPHFPEGYMEDVMSNIRFTFLLSGTGWLKAMDNYDTHYLDEKVGMYRPDDSLMEQFHREYTKWKRRQYEDTEFVTEVITGDPEKLVKSRDDKKYLLKDIDCIAQFIENHMNELEKRGVTGGTGSLVFPPREIDKTCDIEEALSKNGVPKSKVDRIVFLSMKKGKLFRLSRNKTKEAFEGYETDGDTIVIDTSDGRYYCLITAMRSGTRGYNIAFANKGKKYDASGVCLFPLTQIVSSRKKEEELDGYTADESSKYEAERRLEINIYAIHASVVKYGGDVPLDDIFDRDKNPSLYKKVNMIIRIPEAKKDLYEEDPNSPYKLQGVSEILQALGRIRNEEKGPLLYIALSDTVFEKNMMMPEQLTPMYLSYEAEQLYNRLPDMWAKYSAEEVQPGQVKKPISASEAKLIVYFNDLVKKQIPEKKRKYAEAAYRYGADSAEARDAYCILKSDTDYYDYLKEYAMSLGKQETASSKCRDRNLERAVWKRTTDNGKPVAPYSCISCRDNTEEPVKYQKKTVNAYRTYITSGPVRGMTAMTPSGIHLCETIDAFIPVCGKELTENMPFIMDPGQMQMMRKTDMFPYPPGADGYDIFVGEFGERLFKSVMTAERIRGATDLETVDLPVMQYEDFDTILKKGGRTTAYVNVKFRRIDFETEKKIELYMEKAMRAPETGRINLVYINMRPTGDGKVIEKIWNENSYVRGLNADLKKHNKEILIHILSPFRGGALSGKYSTAEGVSTMVRYLNSIS